ncbi:hypothetical protein D3C87_2093900 [compost metagenome]
MGYLLYVHLLNKQKDEERDVLDQFTLYQSRAKAAASGFKGCAQKVYRETGQAGAYAGYLAA